MYKDWDPNLSREHVIKFYIFSLRIVKRGKRILLIRILRISKRIKPQNLTSRIFAYFDVFFDVFNHRI